MGLEVNKTISVDMWQMAPQTQHLMEHLQCLCKGLEKQPPDFNINIRTLAAVFSRNLL